jgi:hypothetical protein
VIRGSVEGQVVGEGDHNGSHVLVRCPTAGCSASTDVDIWITPPAAGAVVHLAALQDDGTAIWLPTSTTPLTKQVQIAATLPAGHVRFYVVSGPQIARDDARAAIEANTALQFAFDVAP